MELQIRLAQEADLPRILEIYADARGFMAAQGNPTQWTGGYPDEATVREDLALQQLYVCLDDGIIAGVFCCFPGPEPDYWQIYDGQWLGSGPYGVIHRIASYIRGKGIATACLQYACDRYGEVRIDTHRDNIPMQRMLEKNGFHRRGIIHLRKNGEERIAYQKR